MYMPKKPAKYGIKMFSIVDAKLFYSANMEVYVGQQPEGPFVIDNKPEAVVKRLYQAIYKSSRNVTTDN